VASRVKVPLGEPLDSAKLSSQLLRLYSLDVNGPIHHEFVHENGKGILKIDAPAKPYGRNSLQFGFNLTDDFRGDSGFNLSVSHLMNPVNRRAGEWRNIIQLGENGFVGTEFYQPLDTGMKWFISPEVQLRRDKIRRYDAEGRAVAEYRVSGQHALVTGGRVFSNWGRLEVGAFRGSEDGRVKIGIGNPPVYESDDGGVVVSFLVDTLDTVTWPRDGTFVKATYQRSIESFGADGGSDLERVEFSRAGTIGKNIFVGSLEIGRTNASTATLTNTYFLGGLLRLSGLAQNQLAGERGGFSRLLYYRELTTFNLGSMAQRVYTGFSLEGGNVYNEPDAVTWQSLRYSGSVFLGADTVVGPAYLGFGYAQGGRTSFYLVIGQRF
jgi:NTE family protein